MVRHRLWLLAKRARILFEDYLRVEEELLDEVKAMGFEPIPYLEFGEIYPIGKEGVVVEVPLRTDDVDVMKTLRIMQDGSIVVETSYVTADNVKTTVEVIVRGEKNESGMGRGSDCD